MPAALLPFALAAASTAANLFAQGKTNRKTRQWNEHMYNRQRTDSLTDWQRQNDYNSPEQQMERLRRAGLNPNLVYDNGATHTADAVRSTDVKSWNPDAPRVDGDMLNRSLLTSYDMRVKEATIDNLKEQNNVMQEEKALKAAQTYATLTGAAKTGLDTKSLEFDLLQRVRLADTQFSTKQAELDKLRADTQSTLTKTETELIMRAPNLQNAMEQILNSRSQRETNAKTREHLDALIKSQDFKNKIDQFEIDLNKKGFTKSDAVYYRMASKFLDNLVSEKLGIKLSTPDDKRRWKSKTESIKKSWPFKIPGY